MPDNEIHVGWTKTLDPKYQSLFYGTYFYFAQNGTYLASLSPLFH